MKPHAAWARWARGYLDCMNERLYEQAYEGASFSSPGVSLAETAMRSVDQQLGNPAFTAATPSMQYACGGTTQLKTAVMQFRDQIMRFHDDVLQYPLPVYNKFCNLQKFVDEPLAFEGIYYTSKQASIDILQPVAETSGFENRKTSLPQFVEHISASSVERELIHRNVKQFQTQVEQIQTQYHFSYQKPCGAEQSCTWGETALSATRAAKQEDAGSLRSDIREKIHGVKHARFSALKLSSGLLNSRMEDSTDLKSTIATTNSETLKRRLLLLLGVAEGPFSDDSIIQGVERLVHENATLRHDNAQILARMAEILAKYPANGRIGL